MFSPKKFALTFVLAVVTAVALGASASAAKAPIHGTYKGYATSTDGATKYGKSSFKLKKGKLVHWTVETVPRDCGVRKELMNYGFTVAPNVLKAYGLKSKNVKVSSKGRLKFTYTQPGSKDKITVNVKFGKKSATGTVVQKPAPGELSGGNCVGSGKFKLKK